MIRLIENLIKKLKGDESYHFKSNFSSRELVAILLIRFFQVLRGATVKIKLRSSKGFVFCGREVKIDHGYNITAGKSLIIEDAVNINGLSENGIVIGNNVTIAKASVIVCTGIISNKGIGIKIGNNSAIGAQSFLGGQGGIEIGNDVIMGPQVKIFSENHNYSDDNILIRKQGENRKGVKIKDNCWVGAGSIILDGVIIESGCVIAAGSVVTTSIPRNSIAAGVPARIIKTRN